MGMDVIGRNPTNKVGEYFRNNVWWWRPLWQYCCAVDADLASKVPYGHSNDGDGLESCEDCEVLASKLQHSIDTGYADFYISQRNLEIERTPFETCTYCEGTGVRNFEGKDMQCNGCEGNGKKKPMDTWYQLNIENIRNFIEFLNNCGGFEIH